MNVMNRLRMNLPRMVLRVSVFLLLCATMLPADAQESGRGGAVTILTFSGNRYLDETLPRLLAVDDQGRAIPASPQVGGLALSWDVEFEEIASEDGIIQGGMLVTYTLRDDLTWADGAPVTAYDVFYSMYFGDRFTPGANGNLLLDGTNAVVAAAPRSDTVLEVLFEGASCGGFEQLNPQLQAWHIDSPGFDQLLTSFSSEGNLADQFQLWSQTESWRVRTDYDINAADWNAMSDVPIVDESNLRVRYLSDNLAINLVLNPPGGASEVDAFIAGDLDVIINPPYHRRADLYALPDVQIVEQVGRTWYALGFNAADSREPESAFDPETGEPIEQGVNAIFGDIRVRQAIEMAIDVDAIGTAATSGYYTRLTGDQLPFSWAFNPVLSVINDPTPFEAGLLLDEAGWRDWDRTGVRECHGCLTAEEGTPLSFSLNYSNDGIQDVIVRMIREQLARIGVDAFTEFTGDTSQAFDAYILQMQEGYPIAADRGAFFRQSEDITGQGANITSLVDPQLNALFETAARAPQCDYGVRAEALMAASEILRENRYLLPLFAVNDLYAAQGAVEGFAPRQNDPYWNIDAWVINR